MKPGENGGPSTLGREAKPENSGGEVRHSGYGTTELSSLSSQPPAHINLDPMKREQSDQPLKYSEHNGLSSLDCEIKPQTLRDVLEHGNYEVVRGDIVGHFDELTPVPAHSSANPDSIKTEHSDESLENSVSSYHGDQRPQQGSNSVDCSS
ncbi:hypothetical protein COOONC_18300 [Cooperia oncophora]